MNLLFSKERFERIFLFFILLNRDLQIIDFGKSFGKILQDTPIREFTQLFSFKGPFDTLPDFDYLESRENQLFLATFTLEAPLLFRGQFEYMAEEDQLLFLASPWFGSIEDVSAHNLFLNDFAAYDPLVDLLTMLKTNQNVQSELEEMVAKVKANHKEILTLSSRMTTLLDGMQSGVLMEDNRRNILFVNQHFCDFFDIPVAPSELFGSSCIELANASLPFIKQPQVFLETIHQLIDEKKISYGHEIETVSGKYFQLDYFPIYIKQVYQGHIWNYRDITERRKTELDLSNSEERYSNIIANMHLGLFELDEQENILFANQRLCSMSGYSLEELVGKNHRELFGYEKPHERANSATRIRDKGVHAGTEITMINKSGKKRWWLISASESQPFGNSSKSIMAIALDITRQKELEIKLKESKKMMEAAFRSKESFFANVSHELRTPINTICNISGHMVRAGLPEQWGTYVDAIHLASENLMELVNDILDLSKIKSHSISLVEEEFLLRKTIQRVLKVFQLKTQEKGISLVYDESLVPDLALLGDSRRFRQVVAIVLENAVKFTESGQVSIDIKSQDAGEGRILISVQINDTGIGMSPDFLKNIFEDFSQEDKTIYRRFGGSGLGMAISKSLIELMGGRIDIKSVKAKGTSVTIKIPFQVVQMEKEIESKGDAGIAKNALEGLKIMVVDDNTLNLFTTRVILESYGARVTEIYDGKECLSILEKNTYDIILMDIQMPVMDGFTLTKLIRERFGPSIPILGYTATVLANLEKKCADFGMNGLVLKPFSADKLIPYLHERLRHKGSADFKMAVPQKDQTPPANNNNLYSLKYFQLPKQGATEFAVKAIQKFVGSTTLDLQTLGKWSADRSWEEIRQRVHKMKTSLHMFDIHGVDAEIKFLENISENTPFELLVKNVEVLTGHLAECMDCMSKDFEVV